MHIVTCQTVAGKWEVEELPRRQTLDKWSVAKLCNSGMRLCNSKESGLSLCSA
jgi:hypothetical protein